MRRLLLLVVLLASCCALVESQHAYSACWTNQKVTTSCSTCSQRFDPCSNPGCCLFWQNAYKFAWNYTVQSLGIDTYYVELGDVLCQTNTRDYIDLMNTTRFVGGGTYSAARVFTPSYYAYSPVMFLRCANPVQSCSFRLTACATWYTTPYCFPT